MVMLLVERKFDNYFWVDENVDAGLKFWFDFGEINDSVFVVPIVELGPFGRLVFLIYLSSFISFTVFFKKLLRLKFFGVFIVFLVKEVSFLSDDFSK